MCYTVISIFPSRGSWVGIFDGYDYGLENSIKGVYVFLLLLLGYIQFTGRFHWILGIGLVRFPHARRSWVFGKGVVRDLVTYDPWKMLGKKWLDTWATKGYIVRLISPKRSKVKKR